MRIKFLGAVVGEARLQKPLHKTPNQRRKAEKYIS